MMVCDLKEEPSAMLIDSGSDTEEMISERFEASRPPGRRQDFPLHHREDILGEHITVPFSTERASIC
jgi:hypothetical protein